MRWICSARGGGDRGVGKGLSIARWDVIKVVGDSGRDKYAVVMQCR